MFVGKPGAYPSEAPLTYPQTLDFAVKAFQGQTLISNISKITDGKSFITLGPVCSAVCRISKAGVYVIKFFLCN